MNREIHNFHIMIRQGITWYYPETEIDITGWLSYVKFLWHLRSY